MFHISSDGMTQRSEMHRVPGDGPAHLDAKLQLPQRFLRLLKGVVQGYCFLIKPFSCDQFLLLLQPAGTE